MIKFLVDECVGYTVTDWLQKSGYDTKLVSKELSGITDNTVLAKAFLEQRILITSDKDFGEIIFRNRENHCGIILLRLLNERPSNKISVLTQLLNNYHDQLEGNFIVVTENSVRITKLPTPEYH